MRHTKQNKPTQEKCSKNTKYMFKEKMKAKGSYNKARKHKPRKDKKRLVLVWFWVWDAHHTEKFFFIHKKSRNN
jgi:hypothetical protein